MQNSIFIPLSTPSQKNSKRIVGKRLISSKLTLDYKKNTFLLWNINREKFLKMLEGLDPPYHIGFYFIRKDKRKFDYVNICQAPLDLMQEHGWLPDDCMTYVKPHFLGYEVSRENCGVQITVLKNVTYEY